MLSSIRRSKDDKQSGLKAKRHLALVANPKPCAVDSPQPEVKDLWLEKLGLEREDLIAIPVCILFGFGVVVISSYLYLLVGVPADRGVEMAATLSNPPYAVLWTAPLALVRKLLRW